MTGTLVSTAGEAATRGTAGRGSLRVPMAIVCLVAVCAAALGIGVRASFGAHVAVDEVQYALTALSLAEDGDLDISDELAQRRWEEFADEKPPTQTEPLDGGRRISPHDPLLPILLAVPVGTGGWVGAKLALSALAGVLAALTLWVAVRRFGIAPKLATVGVGLGFATAPLPVYGQQIYPELPAALAVMAAVAALTGSVRARNLALLVAAVTALPWLSVKYVPVAAALVIVAAVRWSRAGRAAGEGRSGHRFGPRQQRALAAAVLLVMAVGYLAVHRLVWGGWTVYASGDHFQESGEFGVVGFAPNLLGRALRLTGLFADSGYGLVAWQPAWLLLVPALGAVLHRRPPGWGTLLAPLAAGWLVATFVAVTMHGFWWPGRQLVVVLPLALLVVLWWLARITRPDASLGTAAPPGASANTARSGRTVGAIAAGLAAAGLVTYGWLLADGYARTITWVSGFTEVGAPTYRALRGLLPDYRGDYLWPHLVWSALLVALLVAGWRTAPPVGVHTEEEFSR